MTRLLKTGGTLCALLLSLSACNQSPQAPRTTTKQPSAASQAWRKTTESFVEEYMRAQPSFGANAGRHEFDGHLEDISSHGLKRTISVLHDSRKRIESVDPKTLEPREQFQREYLLAVIDKDLFFYEKTKFPAANPAWYNDKIDPDLYLSRNYAALDVRLKAYIRYAREIPKIAKDMQDNFKSPMPRTWVQLGIDKFGGLADFYAKSVGPIFASVNDADLQKQLAEANTSAANAMNTLKIYLQGELKKADDNFALGPDLFAQMVKDTELVDVSVDKIEAAGKADLERNLAALKQECDAYAPKQNLNACIDKMQANKPKGGPVDAAREMLPKLKEFVVKNNIVSVPSDVEALVAEAPPYNRANSAFIQVPGPYDKNVVSIYNISPPDPKWSKAEQAGYIPGVGRLTYTTVHEVWPGHFLQFLHSNSNPNKIEGLWVGYTFAEGWAHYAEEMMHEMGFDEGSPEQHIGQITAALLRDVRLLSAIGLHTHGMTVAQSEKMFREQAFQDAGNARQQAARGTYDPGYLNYTLGKLMIRKLRTDWLAKTAPGGAADDHSRWHEFHDKFLSYGGPPVPLVRKEMVGPGGDLL